MTQTGAAGVEVRPLTEEDLEECEALCKRVHGFERTGALRDAMRAFTGYAAVRDGRIVAYASTAEGEPIALLVPLQSGLIRWCLEQGLRAVKPMNVMAHGEYQEPLGSWFPSVLY